MKRRLRLINFILMFVMCFGALGFMPKVAEAALPTDLFFSEYIEGSSYNKALEVYNGTGSSIDLAAGGYNIKQFSNGSSSASATINLTGTLANNDVYVVTQGSASDTIKGVADLIYGTQSFFNGDDALVLYKGATVLDVIGQVGFDPGTEWNVGGVSTLNMTLVRKSTVCSGDPIGNDAFNPSIEWDGYAQDTFSYLGSHTASCAPVDAAPTVSSTSPADGATKVALDSNITVTFSEPVNLAADWYEIDCSVSGVHTASVDGSADPVIVLDPTSDFVLGDVCEVTIFADKVTDDDTNDPPDTMAEDYTFTFKTLLSPKINEFIVDHIGADTNEYIEVFGDQVKDYSEYTLLQIEGDGTGAGVIDSIFTLTTTDINGFWWTGFLYGPLENGTVSLLLVKDFSGVVGNDIDANNDGVIDNPLWSAIIDTVAIHDGGASDWAYGLPVLVANYDGISTFKPGGASRIPDGYDTESATDWVRNDFDLAGIPGFDGTIAIGEAYNTPGTTNLAYAPPLETAPTVILTSPTNGSTAIATDTNIEITFSEPVTVTSPWFTISCATSGVHTAAVTDADPKFTLNPDSNFVPNEVCTVTIYAVGVTDDDTVDPPDNMAADYIFSFTTGEACGDAFTPTYTIQGSGATSPLVGSTVAVEGVVVGDFTTGATVTGGKNGFYIQDPTGDGNPATSDGLFIYSNLKDVQADDRVRVAGKVAEYVTGTSSLTQITNVTQIWTCSTGNVVAPTVLALPVAADFDYEDYEGMLVTYPQDLVISEYFEFDRYGSIVLTSKRNLTPTAQFEPGSPEYFAAVQANLLDRITLDDARTTQNPNPALHPNGGIFDLTNLFRGGSTLTDLTGILDSYSSLYRIQPTKGAVYTNTNPRTSAPEVEPGELTVTSFNVLNYFLSIDTGSSSWICGPSGDMECRGADTPEELARQRAKILAAMSGIEADVYGLMEIQNDTGASTADLVAGLNDFFGTGTYAYINTGYIGGDAIKQAIIYKPAAVTPVGGYKILDSSVDPRFIDTANRPVLAQVFEDNITGETFVVAVNHLKSKGSACTGDPDLGDGQGNCNLTRKTAAQALVDWLANPVYFAGVENALIIGDLNSYDKEDPIDMIKLGADDLAGTDDDYTDMIAFFQGEDAYGYVFDGQVGYLDHALANKSLADNIIDVNFWHINADEADLIDYNMDFKADAQDAIYAPDAYRSSDHDPVIITLAFTDEFFVTQDFGLWGPIWPGAFNLGWKYNDTFDINTIVSIEVGMLDADRRLIVKYTADPTQVAWQIANSYITQGGQESAPFYQSYDGTPIEEGVGEDWTVVFGGSFASWNPSYAFVKVVNNEGAVDYKTVTYTGAPGITNEFFVTQDFGLWGPTWPGALNLGWKYNDTFNINTIVNIIANSYITQGGQESAPFYQSYEGTPIEEGVGEDWTVVFGDSFAAWNPALAFVQVVNTYGTVDYKTIVYNGPQPLYRYFFPLIFKN